MTTERVKTPQSEPAQCPNLQDNLPDNVLSLVVDRLKDEDDVVRLACVCKRFYGMFEDRVPGTATYIRRIRTGDTTNTNTSFAEDLLHSVSLYGGHGSATKIRAQVPPHLFWGVEDIAPRALKIWHGDGIGHSVVVRIFDNHIHSIYLYHAHFVALVVPPAGVTCETVLSREWKPKAVAVGTEVQVPRIAEFIDLTVALSRAFDLQEVTPALRSPDIELFHQKWLDVVNI